MDCKFSGYGEVIYGTLSSRDTEVIHNYIVSRKTELDLLGKYPGCRNRKEVITIENNQVRVQEEWNVMLPFDVISIRLDRTAVITNPVNEIRRRQKMEEE